MVDRNKKAVWEHLTVGRPPPSIAKKEVEDVTVGPALFVDVKVLSITCKLDLSHNFLVFQMASDVSFPCGLVIIFPIVVGP